MLVPVVKDFLEGIFGTSRNNETSQKLLEIKSMTAVLANVIFQPSM